MYFGAVYIVPSNSSSNKSKGINADTFLILQKETSTFSPVGGHIILGGGGGGGEDFNSRLGNKLTDYIVSDSNDFLPIDNNFQADSSSFTHRYIQDKNTKASG